MTRLKWSPQSQEDMEEIYETIWLENSAAAERMFDKLEDAALSLISYPRLGLRREEVMFGLRHLVVRPYLIFYVTQPDDDDGEVNVVDILRVLHGHQELKERLRR